MDWVIEVAKVKLFFSFFRLYLYQIFFNNFFYLFSFSNFFNPGPGGDGPASMRGPGMTSTPTTATSGPAIRYTAGAAANGVGHPTATPALEAMRRRARAQQNGDLVLMMDSDLSSERARAAKNNAVRAHVTRSGSGDRIQAYGWSITGASSSSSSRLVIFIFLFSVRFTIF